MDPRSQPRPIRSRGQPRLGTLERGELLLVVPSTARVELILVKLLATFIAWLDPTVGLLGSIALEASHGRFDSFPFAGKQLSGTLLFHSETVSLSERVPSRDGFIGP